jgi:sugar/nucleoside kinase (ribokinase family)
MGKGCLVIGAAMLDIIMEIDRLPLSGEDMYAKTQSMTVGGCAYNVAGILKHFRAAYTLFAPVGTGMYASFIEKELKKSGHESPVKSETSDTACVWWRRTGRERFSRCRGLSAVLRKNGLRVWTLTGMIPCMFPATNWKVKGAA